MRSWIGRCWLSVVVLAGAATSDAAQACTNLPATVSVQQVPVAASCFVPTIVSATPPLAVAPVATHVTAFGAVTVPQAVVLPQAVTVQTFAVPQVLQQPIVRQRVRTTVAPRVGVRALFCR